MLTTLVSLATLLPMPPFGSAPSVPPAVALAPVAGLSLASLADQKEEDTFVRLYGMRETRIDVLLSRGLPGGISTADVQKWISGPLKQAGLEILDESKQRQRFLQRSKSAKDFGSSLEAWDRYLSKLVLVVSEYELGESNRLFTVTLEVHRAGILVPFQVQPVMVWSRSGNLYCSSDSIVRTAIRDAVGSSARALAGDCRKAAKLKPGDPRLRPILPAKEEFRCSTKDGGLGMGAGAQRPKSSNSFSDR